MKKKAKVEIKECPFCGKVPSGRKFCETVRGPVLICNHCGVEGPFALPEGQSYRYSPKEERRLRALSVEVWNERNGKEQVIYGIQLAASVAKDYDYLSYHGYLVSECILGKLNVLKGKPRKNPDAAKIKKALDMIERKLGGLEGTVRFMVRKK